MRTTVRLNDALLERARKEAARRGTTLTSLIEQGLSLVLTGEPSVARRSRVKVPVSRASGGVLPGVNLTSSADLMDLMDGLR